MQRTSLEPTSLQGRCGALAVLAGALILAACSGNAGSEVDGGAIPTPAPSPSGIVLPDGGPSLASADAGPDAASLSVATELAIPSPHSGPTGLTLGPDGNLWFTETAAPGKIGRMTKDGVFSEFVIPTPNSAPNMIVTGSDGSLWFTEYTANQIGRITTAGAFTEFPIPTASSGPMGIAAGPDGNIWFSEFDASQIGRVTPAGVVTEFPTPTPNAGPFRIAAAGQSLWFSEKLASAVGRITTAGVRSEIATPTPRAGPLGIFPTANGGVAVCEHDVNQIGTVTGAGLFSESASPTASSFPADVVASADGSLWFTEANVSRLGALDPSGAFREVQVPSAAAGLSALVSDGDGILWFLESSANKIGRFDPSGASTARSTPAPAAPVVAPAPGGLTPQIVGGQLINTQPDPEKDPDQVAMIFPYSTVHISWETPSDGKTHLCTGVILSSTQVLTAAHCQFGVQEATNRAVDFYTNTRTTPTGAFVGTITGAPILPQNVTGIPSAFTQVTGSGFTNTSGDYADLAIATLQTPIDSKRYPFIPIKLSPSGQYSSTWNKSAWIVGTGFMNGAVNPGDAMQYVAAVLSSENDDGGWFQTKFSYTDEGDSGGPVFQETTDGSATLLLLGLTSGFYYVNWGDRFTSVSRTSNYNWIQGLVTP